MADKTWLLVDSNGLAWRAAHTTGFMRSEGQPTGVAFGVLREIEALTELYNPEVVVWAFDRRGPGLRKEIDPGYKNRTYTEDELAQRVLIYEQIDRLRGKILPALGYKNILSARGYEADDIIAKVAKELPDDVDAIIVSGDEDLWQCLSPSVRQYHPVNRATVTLEKFRAKWGIEPPMWAHVKALAGCASDTVTGVEGVGEKTAAKWFAGTLKNTSKIYGKIKGSLAIHNRNIKLVRLPFPGLELPAIRKDACTEAAKREVMTELGIRQRRRVVAKAKGFELE